MKRVQVAIRSGELKSGDRLRISLGAIAPERMKRVPRLRGVIRTVTPKAVRVQLVAGRNPSASLWLPRRALTRLARGRLSVSGDLATWWTPDVKQAQTLSSIFFASPRSVATAATVAPI